MLAELFCSGGGAQVPAQTTLDWFLVPVQFRLNRNIILVTTYSQAIGTRTEHHAREITTIANLSYI